MIKQITKKHGFDLLYLDGEEIGKEARIVGITNLKSFLSDDMKRISVDRAITLKAKGQRVHAQIHWLVYLLDEGTFARIYTSGTWIDELSNPIAGERSRLSILVYALHDRNWSRFQFQSIAGREPLTVGSLPLEEFEAAHLEDIRKSNADRK